MAPAVVNATRICFPGWEVRPVERVLLVAGAPVAIGSRAFDVLLALIEGRGSAVRKAALLDAAWPGLVVEENNISVQVAALRKVLGAGTIATVPGIGYRLSTPVQDAPEPPVHASPQASASAASSPPGRLRPTSELFGRDEELASLAGQVGRVPLLSIIGTGGVGKTALAWSLLGSLATTDDDLHWIDLAPLRDGQQIAPLLSKALGIDLDEFAHAHEEIFAALSHARALVAVDNCEHLRADVADLIDEAIRRAPAVRWLVTSQVPLHVAGEVVYRLGPLPMPRGDHRLAEAEKFGAVALLRDRVAAVDRHFALTEANIAIAVDLCRKLDGLPLAIEMAATRVANLGLERVHQQLGARLRLPSVTRGHSARHHTLRSTFDWSFGLLSHDEQTAFLRLQPFLGGVCDDLAQRMLVGASAAGDDWSAGELLGTLVDKSLLHRGDAPGRFLMLESARDYARELLEERGETDLTRRLHAQVVAAWVASAADDAGRLGDREWSARYEPERHNVRVALAWASENGEPDLLANLVTALALIDTFAQSTSEIVRCEIPMEVLDRAAPGLRANACLEASWAHYMDGSREFGTELALRALDDFRSIGDDAGIYRALAQLIRLYESRPDKLGEARDAWRSLQAIDERRVPLRARLACAISAGFQYENKVTVERLAELEQLALRAGFDALASVCRVQMTDRLLIEHRFEEALAVARLALADAELRPRARGFILTNQVLALVRLDREREAHAPARQALRALPSASYVLIDTFALAAARRGRFSEAALMAGYGAKVRRHRDELPDPAEAEAIEETVSVLRAALAPARLAELTEVGAAMAVDDVLAMALSD